MTYRLFRGLALAVVLSVSLSAQKTGAENGVATLNDVKRIYVAELTGGAQAAALRDLIIASLASTKLFVLTEKEDRADAILKGAADDHSFTDTFDSYDGINTHQTGGKSASGSGANKTAGIYGSMVGGENESHHIKERKHEAYAAVRLCNRDGDVLWSTTQESLGAKFRGASADVAAKVARQMTEDYEHALHPAPPATTPPKT
jgi:hypothetical protein